MELYSLFSNILLTLLAFLLPQHYLRDVEIFLKTLPRDLRLILIAIKLIVSSSFNLKILNKNALSVFDGVVKKHPQKPCFIFEDEVWTFKEVDEYSNKIAHIFQKAGLKKGDRVALVMTNRPQYGCVWMGLAKIGVITAFINTNLRNQPLLHCISAAAPKVIIYSSDLEDALREARPGLGEVGRYYRLGGGPCPPDSVGLDQLLPSAPASQPPLTGRISNRDHLLYIYTSGTTGLPKAAIVPHYRYVMMTHSAWQLLGLREDDVVYNALPLYHSAGGALGVGAAFAFGVTVVLRGKFSASAFIPECIKHKCTVAQYIGEICRYILAVPEKPTDTQHRLRLMVGNGLKPVIWEKFVNRFKIPNIMEIYGSTEGNLQFVNLDNKIGAIGVIPRFLPFSRYMGAIIKVDADKMEPIRGPDGLCIECAIDEPGMFVGLIPRNSTVKAFCGYLDKQETKKKYIYDVFKKGDQAFMSGDLIVRDEMGYLYFKDRTGDTFRWKGENVATSEVEAVISAVIGLQDCVVYGVQIGELEGRAGMAAVTDPSGQIDLSTLPVTLSKSLPRYAVPLFIRIIQEAETTGTYKLKKVTLVKEGFDPSVVKDAIYFRKGDSYVKLTKELYDQIIDGEIPL